jgi:hypothetical protein
MGLELKQQQFNSAMKLYESKQIYKLLGRFVAITNISLQIYILSQVLTLAIGFWWQIISVIAAYLITDFINGLVHLYMDANDNYDSLAGPLIANFHLHHRTPRYEDNNLLVVYFNETGSKIWLVFYLIGVAVFFQLPNSNPLLLYALTYVGILSSIAEVSHYLSHNSDAAAVLLLARIKLLLPQQEHARHHREDNVSYTFLNGIANPLVDFIAKIFSVGYKSNTDLHYATYSAPNMPRS